MKTLSPELHPVPVKSPLYHASVDLIGPLKKSGKGNKYILIPSDYCTKYVQAVALPSKHASETAGALMCVSYRI